MRRGGLRECGPAPSAALNARAREPLLNGDGAISSRPARRRRGRGARPPPPPQAATATAGRRRRCRRRLARAHLAAADALSATRSLTTLSISPHSHLERERDDARAEHDNEPGRCRDHADPVVDVLERRVEDAAVRRFRAGGGSAPSNTHTAAKRIVTYNIRAGPRHHTRSVAPPTPASTHSDEREKRRGENNVADGDARAAHTTPTPRLSELAITPSSVHSACSAITSLTECSPTSVTKMSAATTAEWSARHSRLARPTTSASWTLDWRDTIRRWRTARRVRVGGSSTTV